MNDTFPLSRRSKVRFTAFVAFVVACCANATIALAVPGPTAGIEWELKKAQLSARTPDGRWDTPERARPETVMCTVEEHNNAPLVRITYDMGSTLRILEIVTAPITFSDSDTWAKAMLATKTFFQAAHENCEDTTIEYRSARGTRRARMCIKRLSSVVADINSNFPGYFIDNSATNGFPCGRPAMQPSRGYDAEGYILLPESSQISDTNGLFRTLLERVGTQVNIGIKLSDLAEKDLSNLFGGGVGLRAYKHAKQVLGLGAEGTSTLEEGLLRNLNNEHKSFLILYTVALNVLTGQFLPDSEYQKGGWRRKNQFGLYAKSTLNSLYGKFIEKRQEEPIEKIVSNTNLINQKFCILKHRSGESEANACNGYTYEESGEHFQTRSFIDQLLGGITENYDPVGVSKPIEPFLGTNREIIVVMEARTKRSNVNNDARLNWTRLHQRLSFSSYQSFRSELDQLSKWVATLPDQPWVVDEP